MSTLLTRLKRLSATTFENLIYDLMVLRGLENATWRTPGADGGRDIEGTVVVPDLSGTLATQRWYVECKRYARSLDWPTVREKAAYAENHRADYLLLCTTAALSPVCKDEIAKWEARGHAPRLRYLDGAALVNAVSQQQMLLAKYGLSVTRDDLAPALLPLVQLAAKTVQAAYGKAALGGTTTRELEAGAALVDLITTRVGQLESGARLFSPFEADTDTYEWLDVQHRDALRQFDAYGLRAILCAIRLMAPTDRVQLQLRSPLELRVLPGMRPSSAAGRTLLKTVALWSHCEVELRKTHTVVRARA